MAKLVPSYTIDKNNVRRKVYIDPTKNSEAKKRSRLIKLESKGSRIHRKVMSMTKLRGHDGFIATIVGVMLNTAIRVGNPKSAAGYVSKRTGDEMSTFGLTTLKREHIKFREGKAILTFLGKRGVEQNITVSDPQLVNNLKKYWLNAKDDEPVMNTTVYEVRKFIKKHIGEDFSPKDLRMLRANMEARRVIKDIARRNKPKTKTELNAEINELADRVSKTLGNTRGVAKRSYIDDNILQEFIKLRWK